MTSGLCGSAAEVAGQLLTASEFDKIVDLDSLFECAETCHNDELCVSFEREPATGVCKSSILPAGQWLPPSFVYPEIITIIPNLRYAARIIVLSGCLLSMYLASAGT